MADFSSSSSFFMTDFLNADNCLTMFFSSIFILSLFSRLFCCDQFLPLEMASNNAKTSSLFDDISQGMKQVHLTLKTAGCVIETLLPLCDFAQVMQRASSQSTHHLEAGTFSSILVHGSHLLFNDIPKV
jgi:hypothetical protein